MRSSSFIVAALAIAAPFAAMATNIKPPKVPDTLAVPAGSKAFLIGHAVGTQNYICLPDGAGAKWVLFGPQATVFDDHGRQLMTHFLSPNPAENNALRATWMDSDRTSAVWAVKVAESDDARFVEPGAIKWFLLQVKGAEEGSQRNDRLDEDDCDPSREHIGRRCAGERMHAHGRRRQDEVRALHRRLRLLQVERYLAGGRVAHL